MIEIVEYQPSWPTEFRDIARTLRSAVGSSALRIDHIGSTAVPGLAAKDVLDIQISVAEFDDYLLDRLLALGYTRLEHIERDHCPPGCVSSADEWQKWFFRPPIGQRPTNTHVRIIGRANQQYALLFRDYLRSHPATAAAYASLKRQLARELRDESRYPEVKDPAVDLIYLAAFEWAVQTGWVAGPSDA
jgi:GrpB-like predicted nucleotidyltransferase (UPF0157 family)